MPGPRRAPGVTSVPVVPLVALAAALALAVEVGLRVRHGEVALPQEWARWQPWSDGGPLPPLSGWRFVTAWQVDAPVLAALALPGLAYARAAARVRRRHPTHPWSRGRSTCFAAGLLVVALATCSSTGVYDMSLFSVHMVQHLALIMVAPPLLAAGRPLTLALHSTRNPWHTRVKRAARSRVVTALTWPPVAYLAYAVTIVATHLSELMDAVMLRPWLGQAEHLLYVLAGYVFFVLVFGDEPVRWRLSMPGRLLLVVLSMAVDTFVGLVLMQGTQPVRMASHPAWGSSPLVDTQTGGAIMWFFGDGLMAVLVMLLLRAWTARPEHARRESRSWLERGRQEALAAHTGYRHGGGPGAPAHGADLDDDEQALAAYNAWLSRLAGRPPG